MWGIFHDKCVNFSRIACLQMNELTHGKGRTVPWLWLRTSRGEWRMLDSDAPPSDFTFGKKILQVQLKLLRKEVDKQVLIGGVHSQYGGCICRAHYRGLVRYEKLQTTLVKIMTKAVAEMPTCDSTATTIW